MTKEERQKYKELTKVLPKMLKDKIKKYKFKKKDFMIWYSTKELFFDLLIGVKVKSDDKCYCTAIETIKPLWLDDLLWDLLKMETNKKEPLSLRTIGAFTVSGAELFKNETELKEWTISELEELIDNYLEHFYKTAQSSSICDFYNNLENSIWNGKESVEEYLKKREYEIETSIYLNEGKTDKEYAEELSYIMQEIVESDLVFNISVYTSDDNLIFYSLPEQHSQPDVEVILEKMADVKRQQKTQKDYKEWKKQNQNNETNSD